jgi:cadmium resistance protein CadD (predicted permease)
MVSLLLDGLLPLALGIWMALLGFGVTSLSKDTAKSEGFRRKWSALLKIAGPLIAVWGAYNISRAI